MLRGRLTRIAEFRAHSRLATPVIVKTKRGLLEEVFHYASQFDLLGGVSNRIGELLDMFNVAVFGSLRRMFRVFDMFSVFLPREAVFDLADQRGVEKIYSDEPMWAFHYPTVPQEGVYELVLRGGRNHFTTTAWTRRLIGADVANSKGFTGAGVKVAVVDTGAPRWHPSLRRCEFKTVIPFQHTDENGHGSGLFSIFSSSLPLNA